jgi:predicted acyl esterase
LGDRLVRNRTDGPYYWERGTATRFDKIKVPIYHMLSTASYNHYRSQLIAYTKLNCPQKLLIIAGNLRRALYHEAIAGEIVRWLDYCLKGIDNGIMKEPPVTLFVQGSDEWRYESEYPLKRTEWTSVYLHSGEQGPASQPPYGRLARDMPEAEEPDSYDYPESEAAIEANLPVLAYSTPPASEDRELIGPASLTLYASSTANDAAWIVKIDDVAPDGTFKLISKGWLKASHREVDEARSSSGIPFHPYTNPVPLEPNKVYKFEIEVWPLCRNFKAGHRLRLRIASSDSRVWDAGNFHSAVEQPARLTVHHSKEYPSHLLLPLIPRAVPTNMKPNINYVPKY